MNQRLTRILTFISIFSISIMMNCGGCESDSSSSQPLSSSKEITDFSFASALNSAAGVNNDCTGTITGTDIAVTVPFGTVVTGLIATFETTGKAVLVGDAEQESGVTSNDFTNSVTYTAEAADGTTQDYTVTVTEAPSSAKEILNFGFMTTMNSTIGITTDCIGTITGTNIAVTVPYLTNVADLIATFTITGQSVMINSTAQVSGITSNDFTGSVTYSVTAADSSVQNYIVTVTRDSLKFTWISGSDTRNQAGVYGIKGTPDPANVPGARCCSVSWTDQSGNLWLFGGYNSFGELNDLWKFDGTNWTWVSGNDSIDQQGIYGTRGITDHANVPGARDSCASWIDSSGNLWLFGGYGYDSSGNRDYLNDLWKFNGTNWTWVSGSETILQEGVYGIKGIPDPSNVPGARSGSMSWIDSSGNLWLFGGFSIHGYHNDLWKFDGTNWTWISGSDTLNQQGAYGTKGVPLASSVPGARYSSFNWIDSSGNMWLFGGHGYDSSGNNGYLNDLWKIH